MMNIIRKTGKLFLCTAVCLFVRMLFPQGLSAQETCYVNVEEINPGLGDVYPNSGNFTLSSVINFRADAIEGTSEVRFWIVNGDTVKERNDSNTFSLKVSENIKDGHVNVQVVFMRRRCTVHIGSVSGTNIEVDCNGNTDPVQVYEYGTPLVITGVPRHEGFGFIGWITACGDTIKVSGYPSEVIVNIPSIQTDTTLIAVCPYKNLTIRLTENSSNYGNTLLCGDSLVLDSVFQYNAMVTAEAVPAEGYEFSGWRLSRNGEIISTDNPYIFRATDNQTLWAWFVNERVRINLTPLPRTGGNVIGDGYYDPNKTSRVTPRAEAAPGYEFVSWIIGDIRKTDEPSFSWYLNAGQLYAVAMFKEKEAPLHLSITPPDGGLLSGEGVYKTDYNVRVNVDTLYNGYEFYCWIDLTTGDTLSYNANCLYPFAWHGEAGNKLMAVVRHKPCHIKFNIKPDSTWGYVETETYRYNETGRVTAVPAYGYTFSHWQSYRGTSNKAVLDFIPTREFGEADAVFRKDSFNLVILCNGEEGSVTGNLPRYAFLDTAVFTAEPAGMYVFDGWYTQDDRLYSTDPRLRIMMDRAYRLEARFIGVPSCTRLTVQPAVGGNITAGGQRVTDTIQHTYGKRVEMEAYDLNGFVFKQWVLNTGSMVRIETERKFTFILTENQTLTAVFDTGVFYIETGILPHAGAGKVSVITDGKKPKGRCEVKYGNTAALYARANPGYVFSHFADVDGNPVYYDTVMGFRVTETDTILAVFDTASYPLTVISSHPDGIVFGSGVYRYGHRAKVQAWILTPGMGFSRWCEDPNGWFDIVDGDRAEFNYTIRKKGPDTLYAVFESDSRSITLQSNNTRYGIARQSSFSGMYVNGQTARLTAHPQYGYEFVEWRDENGLVISGAADTFYLQVTDNRTLTAVFRPVKVNLSVFAVSTDSNTVLEGLRILGSGEYNYAQIVHVQVAEVPLGYSFKGWYNARMEDLRDPSVVKAHTLYSDDTLYAVFSPRLLNVNAEVRGMGGVEGGGVYRKGTRARLYAVPAQGWHLEHWLVDGEYYSSEDTVEIDVYESVDVEAVMELEDLVPRPVLNTSEGGGVYVLSDGDDYNAVMRAIANPGYVFSYWSLNGKKYSDKEECKVTLAQSAQTVAHFVRQRYRVSLKVNLPEAVSAVQGEGSYYRGDKPRLSLRLRSGEYEFEGWYRTDTPEETLLSRDMETELEIDGNITVEARVAVKK